MRTLLKADWVADVRVPPERGGALGLPAWDMLPGQPLQHRYWRARLAAVSLWPDR